MKSKSDKLVIKGFTNFKQSKISKYSFYNNVRPRKINRIV